MTRGSPLDAIVRIDGQASRGTGFLVRATDGRCLVLTAAHVADDAPVSVWFAATGTSSPAALASAADGTALRGTADWALLECSQLPDDVAPIDLDELDGPPATPFETFGYPNLYGTPGNGGALHGTVRRTATGIAPYCDELDGLAADQAQGISGAPCLVAEVSIGIINQTLDFAGRIVAGTLMVVPAATVVAESHGVLALATDPSLPYLRLTKPPLDDLDSANLAAMVTSLELPEVAGQQAEPLRRRVARGLLVAPPDRVASALVSVLDFPGIAGAAVRLLVQRESMWIHSATVAGALDLVDRGGGAALDATHEITARLLLRRAAWQRGYQRRWYNHRNCVMVSPATDSPTSVVAAIEEVAIRQLRVTDRAGLRKRATQSELFVLLYKIVPRAETLTAVGEAFGAVRVVFLSAPRPADPAAEAAEVPWLMPERPAGDEDTWRELCSEARDILRDGSERDITDDDFDRVN